MKNIKNWNLFNETFNYIGELAEALKNKKNILIIVNSEEDISNIICDEMDKYINDYIEIEQEVEYDSIINVINEYGTPNTYYFIKRLDLVQNQWENDIDFNNKYIISTTAQVHATELEKYFDVTITI